MLYNSDVNNKTSFILLFFFLSSTTFSSEFFNYKTKLSSRLAFCLVLSSDLVHKLLRRENACLLSSKCSICMYSSMRSISLCKARQCKCIYLEVAKWGCSFFEEKYHQFCRTSDSIDCHNVISEGSLLVPVLWECDIALLDASSLFLMFKKKNQKHIL